MKTKSRNLLTVILAMLCAAAVALGIGFLLPKAEKINANAATVGNAQPEIADVNTDSLNGTGISQANTGTTDIRFEETSSSTNLGSGSVKFSVSLTVPAYTEYTVNYGLTMTIWVGASASTTKSTANLYLSRYEDSSYAVQKGATVHANVSLAGLNVRDNKPFNLNNLIFTNDTASAQPYKVYFKADFAVASKTGISQIKSEISLVSNSVTSTDLAGAPATNDDLTLDYDNTDHTVNFTYGGTTPLTDLDNITHNYSTGFKNVNVTVEAKDGDDNTITAPTLNLDPNEGKGSITAKDSGIYTVTFKLTTTAIGNGIKWGSGGTDPKTIVLTINKIDPTVNPVYGEPEEVDGNPGKWYVSNDLYRDISIETTIGETPATSDTPGTISWDTDQSLTAGTKNYGWTFTPTDTRNYNTKTGTKSITVESLVIDHITAKFTQGTTKFYTSNKLDDLKIKLAVSKVYNDGTEVLVDPADYELDGDISTAGTANVQVTFTSSATEQPAREEFTDTFDVVITAVAIKSISASFDPTGDIYLSNSLDDLKQYLTVNATYNDGKTKNNVGNYTLSTDSGALSLGTVTVTVTSDEDGTVIDTFDVEVIPDIVPVVLPLPQAKDYTYSGEELDVVGALTTLTEEDVIKYLDVTGNASARRAGEYTVKFRIKDEFLAAGNVSWDLSNADSLPDVQVSADGKSVEFKWNILKAKVAAKWDEEDCLWVPVIVGTLAETTEPNFFINTYTNSDGKQFKNREKLAGGRTYQVTATINPQYSNDFELDESSQTQINSGSETYTYTPPYVPTIWEKIVAFLKANWLWFVIAAAALILLIIIIVVAKKCHKTKEQREEIRARKEEERRRREEERRLQQERLQAERDLARAKQEAELEKIRAQAQAGMAGAGMASMAMAQPMQQPVQQPVQYAQPQMQMQSMPVQQQMPQSYSGGMMERIVAELAAIREENKSKTEAELANAKLLVEFERLRGDMRGYGGTPYNHMTGNVAGNAIPADVVIALIEAVKSGNPAPVNINTVPQALPQSVEESAPVTAPAVYPPDAVVTTTTTVDTTQKPLRRERDEAFADVDGFYDSIDY